MDDETHVVGLCAAIRVNEGHHVLAFHIAQDQLGVVLKEVHLKQTWAQDEFRVKIVCTIFSVKVSLFKKLTYTCLIYTYSFKYTYHPLKVKLLIQDK